MLSSVALQKKVSLFEIKEINLYRHILAGEWQEKEAIYEFVFSTAFPY